MSRIVAARIRTQAGNRCGYCRSAQRLVLGPLELEDLIPRARGGASTEENLWLACRLCNSYKGAQVRARDPGSGRRVSLFNPRRRRWRRHFRWSADGLQIIGLTASGRATVLALQLNNEHALLVRSEWVSVGWHPPAN